MQLKTSHVSIIHHARMWTIFALLYLRPLAFPSASAPLGLWYVFVLHCDGSISIRFYCELIGNKSSHTFDGGNFNSVFKSNGIWNVSLSPSLRRTFSIQSKFQSIVRVNLIINYPAFCIWNFNFSIVLMHMHQASSASQIVNWKLVSFANKAPRCWWNSCASNLNFIFNLSIYFRGP